MRFTGKICIKVSVTFVNSLVVNRCIGIAVDKYLFTVGICYGKQINGCCAVACWGNCTATSAATDSVCICSCNRLYRTSSYGDIVTVAVAATADSCSSIASGCSYCSAAYGDIGTVVTFAAADSCSMHATSRRHCSAAYGDIVTLFTFTTADSCSSSASDCGNCSAAYGDV